MLPTKFDWKNTTTLSYVSNRKPEGKTTFLNFVEDNENSMANQQKVCGNKFKQNEYDLLL